MDIEVLGIDLGKAVCSLAGADGTGAVVLRKRLQRHRLLSFLKDLQPCVVAMEACGRTHHIGRFCVQHGHEPRLMSPLYVRPYVKVHKMQRQLLQRQRARRCHSSNRKNSSVFRPYIVRGSVW